MGRLCYPTQHPGRVLVPRGSGARKLSRCKEGMAHFLPSRCKFYWALRVSRYKFDRSREFITGYKDGCGHWRSVAVQSISKPENCQDIMGFNCVQMRVSGCRNHYKFVFDAGAKAKTVTNNLPILSVLGGRSLLIINLKQIYLEILICLTWYLFRF